MKKLLYSLSFLVISFAVSAQTLTELLVPQYFTARTGASAGNARMPVVFCFQITGLTPNQAYDMKVGLALTSDAATTYGAGNQWNGTALNTNNYLNAFTTDATGNSGPLWGVVQPTGNATGGRFAPGALHNIRYGIVTAGGTMPGSPSFVGSKTITGLDVGTTALTPATTDDGAFLQGNANAVSSGKYVAVYSNTAGTGDPIAIGWIKNHAMNQGNNSELPTVINGILMGTTSVAGDYALLIPIGANNANGIQRIESRDASNTVLFSSTAATGIWPSGPNTTTAARRDVLLITSTDAPLPVVISAFTATKNADATILRWSTASEGNNSYFEIQRSTDSKKFEAIGTVKGSGNSSKKVSYSFTDGASFAAKTLYYRLKQVDFDGKAEYSKTVNVSNIAPAKGISNTLPNPFNDELNVTINVASNVTATVVIMDLIGKVHHTSTEQFQAGANKVSVNTTDMPDGIYFVRVSYNGESFTQKVIKK
jgi:hypothetical protein